MWDLVKKLGQQALGAGVSYVKHASFVEQLLQSPDAGAGYALLQARVREMDDAEFHAFRNAVNAMIGMTRLQVRQARAIDNDPSAWGDSFEDKLAYFQARTGAGVSAPSSRTTDLEQRLYWLEVIAQSADQIRVQMDAELRPQWDEAALFKNYLSGQAAAPTPEQGDHEPLPHFSEDGIDLQTRRAAAFKRHLDQLFPRTHETESGPPGNRPLEPLEALQRYLALDRRMLSLMPRTLPGQADEEVVSEARALRDDYAELLQVEPYGGIYSHDQIRNKMAQCVEYAGRTAESLRDDDRAVAFYREAIQLFREAAASDEARRLEAKTLEIERHRSGDFDQDIATLRARLNRKGLSDLERAEALIALGEVYLRGGDTYAATEPLHEAEGLLDEKCGGNPDPDALAQALMGSIRGIADGSQAAGGTEIERIMQVRGLYTRLYAALSDAVESSDPAEAERYHRLAEEMDSTATSQAFGGAATGLMFGEYADVFGLDKRS